ncbi:MAG: aldehyde dehydrogenase family protein [Nocardiaceae bacterium]|nr:aldehyde dehydrogenase family protein [Nocardiaceae bacterium]
MTATDTPLDTAELDAIVANLHAHAKEWADLPAAEKADLMDEIRGLIADNADEWVKLSVAGKKVDPSSPWAGEEWISGPWATAAALEGYADSLRKIAMGEKPKPKAVRTRADGQVIAKVYPMSLIDSLLMNGVTAEVWMQEGVTPENLANNTAVAYDQPFAGEVALVLGGGNINSIPPLDTLYELVADRRVVLLKMNPVNDYLADVMRAIFSPLIDRGFVAVVSGGTPTGAYLTRHDGIDKIHITGSARSHDAILFGVGKEGEKRKAKDQPEINKPFTSELGGVGPVIVVPGPWNKNDVKFQAENIATMKLHNSGHNCIAAQVVILSEGWELREPLVESINEQFRSLPSRPTYYPGADARLDHVLEEYPSAKVYGEGYGRREFIGGLDSTAAETAFQEEYFCPALAQTTLPSTDPLEFLRAAIDFANDKLMGTLGATILIHPKTIKEIGEDTLENEIARLKYGAIGVNLWNAGAFLISEATWGAFPGHARTDIQSGTGVVHNVLLFDKPQKTVVKGPWYAFPRSFKHGKKDLLPKPPWFVTNKTAATTGRRIASFAARPQLRKIPGIFASALRG